LINTGTAVQANRRRRNLLDLRLHRCISCTVPTTKGFITTGNGKD
jgi:hypothetical protein